MAAPIVVSVPIMATADLAESGVPKPSSRQERPAHLQPLDIFVSMCGIAPVRRRAR